VLCPKEKQKKTIEPNRSMRAFPSPNPATILVLFNSEIKYMLIELTMKRPKQNTILGTEIMNISKMFLGIRANAKSFEVKKD
jgi:hypothetical protein